MKKLFIPIISLLALTSLAGCSGDESYQNHSGVDYSDLKIVTPSGAPALAVYDMYKNDNIEINGDPSAVLGYLSETSDKDIVIAPTNALVGEGIKGGAPYKIGGVITFGNFYLVATGNDDNDTIDTTDYIVLFQKPGLPGKLFNYCYGTNYNTKNVAGASLAATCLETGVNAGDNNNAVDYVLVAEPGISTSIARAKEARPSVADRIRVVKNLQQDYATKSGNTPITQASIFIRNTTDEDKLTKINAFLSDVDYKFNQIKQNQDDLSAKLSDLSELQLKNKFGAGSLDELKEAVKNNTINIGYQKAKDYKQAIDNFLQNLGFASEETDENLYW